MLDSLRESTHGVFGKILLTLLVISFGVWGIGDIFHVGGGPGSVAIVGKKPISLQEYSRALRARQEELQQRLGRAYDKDLIKNFHLGAIVVNQLINDRLIDNETSALGIEVGNEDIVNMISKNTAFQKNGKFDKETYLAILKSNGIAEQRYVKDLREETVSKLLIGILGANVVISNNLAQAIYAAREEKRALNIMAISPSEVKQAPAPTEQEIKAYYDAHSKSYLTSEYRDISYVIFSLADIQSKIQVPDEDIKQLYNDRVQDYTRPERYQLEHLVFEKEQDAAKAYDEIAHGKHFNDIAKTANITNKDKTSLGLVGRQDLPKEDAAEVFRLKEGETSKPLSSDFGWHIFHVDKIVPQSSTPLSEVRADIVKELKAAKASDTLTRLTNQMEDDMAGGVSFDNAAGKAGAKIFTVRQVARDGKLADGKKAAVAYDNIIDTGFSYNEKEHSQVVQASDGSYFIVHVDSVTPQNVRPLAEVKDSIISALKAQKNEELLKKAADDAATKLREGKKPEIQPVSVAGGNIKRDGMTTEDGKIKLPNGLVAELFFIAPHQYTHAYKAENGDYLIASLDNIIPAPAKPDPSVIKEISGNLKASLEHEIMSDYLAYLRGKYPVSVNESLLSGAKDDSGGE